MQNLSAVAYGLAVLASFLLIAAGAKLAFRAETRTRGVLMIVAALVLLTNVMIWTV
jgi:hypothetical protein